MTRNQTYWVENPPSGAKRWQGANSGAVLDFGKYAENLFKLYRRYAMQWNDIELDHSRELSEHTHRICGAHVISSSGKFILTLDLDRESGWILEIVFARGFHQYYPGFSTGLNALRSETDIKRILLHWRGRGREAFDEWLIHESTENGFKVEWTEYKGQ